MNNFKSIFLASQRLLADSRNVVIFMLSFFFIILLLQWLFDYKSFWQIISNSALSFLGKVELVVDGFFAIFKYGNDITPISFILIGLFQALSITMLLNIKGVSKKKGAASLTAALIGSGCVACGGSVLTPLLSAIATGVSVAFAQRVGDIVLLVAIVLSYRALSRVVAQYESSQKIIAKS